MQNRKSNKFEAQHGVQHASANEGTVNRLFGPKRMICMVGAVSLLVASSALLILFSYQYYTPAGQLFSMPVLRLNSINAHIQGQPVVEGCPAADFAPRLYLGHHNFTSPGRWRRSASLPQNFSSHNLSKTVKADYLPKLYSKMHAGSPHDNQPVQLHWILTSCSRYIAQRLGSTLTKQGPLLANYLSKALLRDIACRQQWGRTISSALLSGFANDLYPASINILWCRPYNASDVPPLLYNLRHSHQVNIFYMSPELQATSASHIIKLLVSALMIPCALGMPNVPILYTEDDVVFAPDANARLSNALSLMPKHQLDEPFALSLYNPGEIKPTPENETDIKQKRDDFGDAAQSHSAEITKINPVYGFGIQGVFFSPAMASLLLNHNLAIVSGNELEPGGWQDLIIWNTITQKWKCNQPGSGCSYYSVEPSLVQHIGTTSAVFMNSGVNQRYHASHDFPVRIRFPGYEPDRQW